MTKLELSNFDAIAFDLEGTLADTIPTHHRTRQEAFRQHGFGHITKEQHELGPTYGSSHFDILGGILHAAGEIDDSTPYHSNQTVLDVIETKGRLFTDAALAGFEEMPGAIDFFKKIAALYASKTAIITSSEEEFVYPFLERYDILSYFEDNLVIGHETVISNGLDVKPSGDPYSLAMRRLGTTSLLVFEDTVSGVTAAKKAGATVFAIAFDTQNSLLFKNSQLEFPPDVVVDSYEEAAELLGLQ